MDSTGGGSEGKEAEEVRRKVERKSRRSGEGNTVLGRTAEAQHVTATIRCCTHGRAQVAGGGWQRVMSGWCVVVLVWCGCSAGLFQM